MMRINTLLAVVVLVLGAPTLAAEDYYARQSLELGVERFSYTTRPAGTTQSNLNVNLYLSRGFLLGTNQSVTSRGTLGQVSDLSYRPDIHFGFLFPLIDALFAEVTFGIDLLTSAIIAAAFANSRSNYDVRFPGSYPAYLNLATALRVHVGDLALKVIGQMQVGGYDRASQVGSAWLGLGATYRFAL